MPANSMLVGLQFAPVAWLVIADSEAARQMVRRFMVPRMLSLTPWLTGAGSRRLEGTNIGHENAEGMAYVGVRVEPPVRLGSAGTVVDVHSDVDWTGVGA